MVATRGIGSDRRRCRQGRQGRQGLVVASRRLGSGRIGDMPPRAPRTPRTGGRFATVGSDRRYAAKGAKDAKDWWSLRDGGIGWHDAHVRCARSTRTIDAHDRRARSTRTIEFRPRSGRSTNPWRPPRSWRRISPTRSKPSRSDHQSLATSAIFSDQIQTLAKRTPILGDLRDLLRPDPNPREAITNPWRPPRSWRHLSPTRSRTWRPWRPARATACDRRTSSRRS